MITPSFHTHRPILIQESINKWAGAGPNLGHHIEYNQTPTYPLGPPRYLSSYWPGLVEGPCLPDMASPPIPHSVSKALCHDQLCLDWGWRPYRSLSTGTYQWDLVSAKTKRHLWCTSQCGMLNNMIMWLECIVCDSHIPHTGGCM